MSHLHAGSFVLKNLPELVPRPQVCQPHLWQSGRIKKQKGGRTRFLAFFTAAETLPRRTNTRGLQGSFIASAISQTHNATAVFFYTAKENPQKRKRPFFCLKEGVFHSSDLTPSLEKAKIKIDRLKLNRESDLKELRACGNSPVPDNKNFLLS